MKMVTFIYLVCTMRVVYLCFAFISSLVMVTYSNTFSIPVYVSYQHFPYLYTSAT